MVASADAVVEAIGLFDEPPTDPARRRFAQYVVGELGNAALTAYTYEMNIRCVERFLTKPAIAFDAGDVRRFMRLSTYNPGTKNGCLVAIKAYVRFLLLEECIDPDRALRILNLKGPKKKRVPRWPLTLDEVHTLLDACSRPNEFRVIYGGIYQGFRVSDSAIIRPEHLLSDRIQFVSCKGDKPLSLPLHVEYQRVASVICETTPTRNTLKSTCKSLSHVTGVRFGSHRLRDTFACRHDDLGAQEGVVIELLGHEQKTVYRRHYAPVTWAAMEEAQDVLHYDETRRRDRALPQRDRWKAALELDDVLLGRRYHLRLVNGSSYRGDVLELGATIRLAATDGAVIELDAGAIERVALLEERPRRR